MVNLMIWLSLESMRAVGATEELAVSLRSVGAMGSLQSIKTSVEPPESGK